MVGIYVRPALAVLSIRLGPVLQQQLGTLRMAQGHRVEQGAAAVGVDHVHLSAA